MKTLALVIAIAALGTGLPSRAQTPSELLQRGIYLQETMGDLDGAIKVYRQVGQLAQGSRASAAQALYRLAVCLEKKNQTAEATQALQKVIDDYPEQTDVVEKARALLPSGLKLLPVPWVDGEILDFSTSMGNGPIGVVTTRYMARTSRTNPANWELETRMYNPVSMFLMRVETDREAMKPVLSVSTNPMIPSRISYQGSEAHIEMNGRDPITVKLQSPVFDTNEIIGVLRRLPLAPGYKTTLNVLATSIPEVTRMGVTVMGEEDVKTPAGQFHAYRVQMNLSSTYWISTDPSRYLVKYESGAMMKSELTAIRRADQSSTYRDQKDGFSLSLPAGWTLEESYMGMPKVDFKRTFQLVDVDSQATVTLTVEPKSYSRPAPTVETMRAEVPKANQSTLQPQKLRADSVQSRQVGGNPALNWIADTTGMMDKSPLIAYHVWVRTQAMDAEFTAMVAPQDFAALRPRLDTIIDTLTLKQKWQ